MHRTLSLLMVFLGVSLVAADAHAYKVAVTSTEEALELHWDNRTVPFRLELYGDEGVDTPDLDAALVRALASWGEVSTAGIRFQRDDVPANPVSEADGRNVLYWTMEAWPHEQAVIALTSINYYPDRGEIADVDIDFNGQDYTWTVTDTGVRTDVQAIASHELGHFVGLDHSEDESSTMWAYYDITPGGVGETRQRELSEDDEAGITYMYPCEPHRVVVGDYSFVATEAMCDDAFFTPPQYEDEDAPWTHTCSALPRGGRVGLWIAGLLTLALAGWRRHWRARLPLLVWALVFAGTSLPVGPRANVTPWASLEGLLGDTRSAVHGEVLTVEPYWGDDGHVHSLVQVHVTEWLRGGGDEILWIDRPSGELPGFGTAVPGDPRFDAGDEVLLLLAPRNDGSPGLLGMAQGFIEVVDADGVPVARRQPMGPTLADHPGGTEYYPLEGLLGRLRTP
jgi:hypothetical protein